MRYSAVLLLCLASSALPAFAGDEDPRIAAIVKRLGDEEFAVREAAQKELESLDTSVLPVLSKYYRETADREIQYRIEIFVRARFWRDLLPRHKADTAGLAFLGLSYQAAIVPGSPCVVQVHGVVPVSPAKDADLRVGDHITAVDGKPIPLPKPPPPPAPGQPPQFRNPADGFKDDIAGRSVGAVVTLTVVREEKPFDVKARLICRPKAYCNEENGCTPEQVKKRDALESLEKRWWDEAFLKGLLVLPDAESKTGKEEQKKEKAPEKGSGEKNPEAGK
jgi:hypothetical protein